MKFHFFVLGVGVVAPMLINSASAQTKRPNIIILQADDMGYDDMSLRGNTCVNTPNLDRMAQSSTSFENFYVHSVSAPTRASLLTGRHFLRVGVSGVHAGRDFVNLDEVMISEIFQEAGYKTGMWGKWHSGKTSGYFPWERGFDEAYFAELYHHHDNHGLLNGEEYFIEGWTDPQLADMLVDFIDRNKDEEFFAYLPFLAPHGLLDAPEEMIQMKMAQGQSRAMATLTSMVEQLDAQVGKVFEAVEDAGILDNTIIIFLSDNGPINMNSPEQKLSDEEWRLRNPSRYRGNKGQNFENGIHSPLFVYWKGHFEPVVNNSLVAVYDLLPTLCDIAGVEIPERTKELDGVSFKEILENPTIEDKDRSLYIAQWTPFFEWHNSSAEHQEFALSDAKRAQIDPAIQMIGVRSGDDKMLYNMRFVDTIALWNIKIDHKETNNLFLTGTEQDKQRAEAYRVEVLEWYTDMLYNDNCYHEPTFQVGIDKSGFTQLLAYGPCDHTEGLLNSAHALKGFDTVGEGAQYSVDVHKAGMYSFSITPMGECKGTMKFKITTDATDQLSEIILEDGKSTWADLILSTDVKRICIELIETSGEVCDLKSIEVKDKSIINN